MDSGLTPGGRHRGLRGVPRLVHIGHPIDNNDQSVPISVCATIKVVA